MSPSVRSVMGPLCPQILGLRAPSEWDGVYYNAMFARIDDPYRAGAQALGLEVSRAAYANAAPYYDPYMCFAGRVRAHPLRVIPLLSDHIGWLRAAHWFAEPYRRSNGCFDVERLDDDIAVQVSAMGPGWYMKDPRWQELQMARRVIDQARAVVVDFDRECDETIRGRVRDVSVLLAMPNPLRSGLLLVDRDVGVRLYAQLPGAMFEDLA